jgi:ribonuclease VapC
VIVDSSAILAILFREPGFEAFDIAMAEAPTRSISAATFVEVSIVVEPRGGDRGVREWDAFVRRTELVVEPVTEMQAYIAREAYSIYGKGRHAAGLNFGDCFSYALAKALDEPLLFKGEDFRKTDVVPAIA